MANSSSDDGGEVRSKTEDEASTSPLPDVSERSEGEQRSSSPERVSAHSESEERSSLPPDPDAEETRASRHTERPVAHSVKPPPPPSTKRGFVWVAMLGLFGVVGYMLREPDPETALAARNDERPSFPTPSLEVAPSEADSNPAPNELGSPGTPATIPSPEDTTERAPADPTLNVASANPQRDVSSRRVAARPATVAARTLADHATDVAPVAPSAATPAKLAPFSHKSATASLDQSARAASTCRRGTDPSGVARAVVSFAPTGRVTAAVISGPPFAGTETGSCIARTLRQTVIPAFEGPITTVAKTVEVQ